MSEKKKVLLFCAFLGWLGVHRFIVGKVGTGVLFLLTGGFFGIGSLIDLLKIVFGDFKKSNGSSLKEDGSEKKLGLIIVAIILISWAIFYIKIILGVIAVGDAVGEVGKELIKGAESLNQEPPK